MARQGCQLSPRLLLGVGSLPSEHHVVLGKAARDRQCLQPPRVTHCAPLKRLFSNWLWFPPLKVGWGGPCRSLEAAILVGWRPPSITLCCVALDLACGFGWLVSRRVSPARVPQFPIHRCRRQSSFLRELERPQQVKPGLRAPGAEWCLFPDLSGVSPNGWRDLPIESLEPRALFPESTVVSA